jgi:hypothetical protein
MIIVKLIGGLGNQMFQYAAGKALSLKNGVPLKIDLSFLNKDPNGQYTKRELELKGFDLSLDIATQEETTRFKQNFTNYLALTFPGIFPYYYAKEVGTPYHASFQRFPKNTLLDGFWQSELYFKNYFTAIREAFRFKEETIAKNNDIAQKMKTVRSVSLHVRRGDYVSNALANKFHGLCTPSYYQEAVKFIQGTGPVELFIFSDDIDWCKQHSRFDVHVHYMQTGDAFSDLYLMTQCQHHVIANSSFSWWGAWLNPSPEKIVVAPKNWFQESSINTNDIVPKGWVKL